jgi:PTH1 family peptidyl-tRNA hydrolase
VEPTHGAAWLVAGLGNPGSAYRHTRHNVGFEVVDRLATSAGARFRSGGDEVEVAWLALERVPVALLKPQTFMNRCGPAVAAWRERLALGLEKLLVIHDDLDLPLGRLRLVPGGGAGGHRGVASIQEALGSREVPRVRIGIGRPPDGEEAAEFVLQDFRPEEHETSQAALDRAAEAVRYIIADGLEAARSRFNARPPAVEGAGAAAPPSTQENNRGAEGG